MKTVEEQDRKKKKEEIIKEKKKDERKQDYKTLLYTHDFVPDWHQRT